MKKVNAYFLLSLLAGILSLPLEGAYSHESSSKAAHSNATAEAEEEDDEYDIMARDEIDDTDAYAIPFDDSEVEDEEQIDRDEKKDVFHLPHSR